MLSKDEIIVIDDIISPQFQDTLEQWLLAGDCSWYFSSDVAFADDVVSRNDYEKRFAFSKTFFNIANSMQHPMFSTVFPMLLESCHKINATVDQTLFSRSFLTIPLPGRGLNDYDHIHVDTVEPHSVCLYYVNDSDGDTIFFDRTLDEFLDDPIIKHEIENVDYTNPGAPGPLEIVDKHIDKSQFKIFKRVTPKKGRAVFFNGYRYHSAARPSKGYRLVINNCFRGTRQ